MLSFGKEMKAPLPEARLKSFPVLRRRTVRFKQGYRLKLIIFPFWVFSVSRC